MRTSPSASMMPPPPLGVRVRRAGLTAGVVGSLALLVYARAVPCVFAHVFRVPCPGCGSSRAVVALLHGDVDALLRSNALGPVMALLLAVLAVQALGSVLVHGDLRAAGEGRLGRLMKHGVFVVAGLSLVLWIARFFGLFGGPVPVG